jgi:hypothetical protein
MDKKYCATRNHIELGDSKKLPDRGQQISLAITLRGCLFGLSVWVAFACLMGVLLSAAAAAFVGSLFFTVFGIVCVFRLVQGHTVRCGLLGALAATLRLVDML